MVKKSASLAGKGVDILFGGRPQEDGRPVEAVAEPGSEISDEAGVEESEPSASESTEEIPAAVESPISPEWEAELKAEASAVEVTPVAESDFASAQPTADQGRPDWPAVRVEDEDRPTAPEPEEDMAALATTPIESPLEQPTEGLPSLATTPAATVAAQPEVAPVHVPQPLDMTTGREVPMSEEARPAASAGYTPPVVPPTAGQPPAALPQPRDKAGMAASIERIKLTGAFYDTSMPAAPAEALDIKAPEAAQFVPGEIQGFEQGQPSRIRRETEIIDYVGHKQRQALWDEVNQLYEVVPKDLSTHEEQATALRLLQEAQDLLMEKPRQFDVAKYKVSQVKALLERRRNITHWTYTWGWLVFAYDLIWIVSLLYTIFVFEPAFQQDMSRLWSTILWGAFGGVTNGFYGLYRHASEKKDFDKSFVKYYLGQPFIGALMGVIIHLFFSAGFISATGVTTEGTETAVTAFPYLVAFLAGFQQRFVFSLIARVIEAIAPSKPAAQPPAPGAQPPASGAPASGEQPGTQS